MIKLCIFDLDGTILNTLDTISYYVNLSLEKFNIEKVEKEKYKLFVGKGAKNLIKNVLTYRNSYNDELFNKVYTFYNESYNKNATYKTSIYEGVKETLDSLKQNNIKIAIVSNKPDYATKKTVSDIFPKNYFDLVFGAREDIPLKPDPYTVLEVINHFKVLKNECIYVGDSGTDMVTGKNADVFTVGVSWGFRKKDELIKNGADRIIDIPYELNDIIKSL